MIRLDRKKDRGEIKTENKFPHIKLVTLSGNNEVGRNCSFLEDRNTIILIDAGLSFPEHELLGIDYLIPNLSYLKKNKHKIKAIFITHGHLDHIGGLPHMLPELGFPKIYAGSFASRLIKQKLKEYKDIEEKVRIIEIEPNKSITINRFNVRFIGVTHSIPNAYSIFVETQVGNIFFSGDFKIDETPANEQQTDYLHLKQLQGKVDLALIESTNSTTPGKARSETKVSSTIEDLIKSAKGRVFIASFASQVSRLYVVSKTAFKLNKKIVLVGRSLKEAFRIAKELNYIEIPEKVFISPSEASKYPDKDLVFLCTGSQGEHYGALNMLSLGQNRFTKIKVGDRVILSSSEIPGNEYKIGKMTDRLIRLGAELITNRLDSVHATGHGLQEDLKTMFNLIKPKKVMPIHGTLTMRYFNKLNFLNWGMIHNNVLLTEDGQVWQFARGTVRREKAIPSKPVLVDAMGISDVGDVVLKDREILSEYGMICIVMNLTEKNKEIWGRIRFASRGFIYMNKSKELLKELDQYIRQVHKIWVSESKGKGELSTKTFKELLSTRISKFLYAKTKREPLIQIVLI